MVAVTVEGSIATAPDDDRRLLEAFARRGDREALSRLLERHLDAIYRVASRLCGNAADADDAVQEAVLGVVADARRFRGEGSVRSWILAITANAARRQRRAAQRRRRREAQASPPVEPDPAAPDESLRSRVRAELSRLPERYRVPVELRFLERMEISDIAGALRAKEKTVRSWIERGLRRLRGALAAEGLAGEVVVAALTQAPSPVPAQLPAALAKTIAGVAPSAAIAGFSALGAALAALAVIAGGVLAAALIPRHASAIAAHPAVTADPPAAAPDPVAEALERPLAMALRHDRLGEIAETIALRLRPARVPIAFPRTLADEPWAGVTLAEDRPTLRRVLDAIAAQGAMRWRADRHGIVIDRPLPRAELDRLRSAWEKASDADARAAADALAWSGDVDALAPLLVALRSAPARARAAREAIEDLIQSPMMRSAVVPDRSDFEILSALAADRSVRDAVLAVVADEQADPRIRVLAICAAGHMRLDQARPALVPLAVPPTRRDFEDYRSPDPDRRSRAAARDAIAEVATEALGQIGGEGVADALLARAGEDAAAVRALVSLGDPRAVDALIANVEKELPTLRPGRGFNVRLSDSIQGLEQLGGDRALALITCIAAEGPDQPISQGGELRIGALRALGRLGGEPAVEPLLAVTRAPQGTGIELIAVSALGEVDAPRARAALLELAMGKPAMSQFAAKALAGCMDASLVAPLRERLRSLHGNDTREIYACLGLLRAPEADRVLLEATPDTSDEWAVHAWYDALGQNRTPAAEARLLADCRGGATPMIRRAAVHGLLYARSPAGSALLPQLAHDADATVRAATVIPLAFDSSPACTRALVDLVHDDDARVRGEAVVWIDKQVGFMTAAGAPLLIALAGDSSRSVRERAQSALCYDLSCQSVAPAVRRLAGDAMADLLGRESDPGLRLALAEEFAFDAPPSAAGALLAATTSDADAHVRAQAAWSLIGSRVGDVAASRASLRARIEHESDARVRAVLAAVTADGWSARSLGPDWWDKPPAAAPAASPAGGDF